MRSHKTKRTRRLQKGGELITFEIKPIGKGGWGATSGTFTVGSGETLEALHAYISENMSLTQVATPSGAALYLTQPDRRPTVKPVTGFKTLNPTTPQNKGNVLRIFFSDSSIDLKLDQLSTYLLGYTPPAPPPAAMYSYPAVAPGYPPVSGSGAAGGYYHPPALGYYHPPAPGYYHPPALGYPPVSGSGAAGGYPPASGYYLPPPPPSPGQLLLMTQFQSPEDKKRAFGNAIFARIQLHGGGDDTGKLSGMLLEGLSFEELATIIDNDAALIARMGEAKKVLADSRAAAAGRSAPAASVSPAGGVAAKTGRPPPWRSDDELWEIIKKRESEGASYKETKKLYKQLSAEYIRTRDSLKDQLQSDLEAAKKEYTFDTILPRMGISEENQRFLGEGYVKSIIDVITSKLESHFYRLSNTIYTIYSTLPTTKFMEEYTREKALTLAAIEEDIAPLLVGHKERAQTKYVSCKDNLTAFHQFTGQCWQDAAMVFLLFAGKIGLTSQMQLQKSIEQLHSEFDAYCDRKKEFILSFAASPDTAESDFENVKKYGKDYIQFLHLRYSNWEKGISLEHKHPLYLQRYNTEFGIPMTKVGFTGMGVRLPAQRVTSQLCSIAQEVSAQLTSEYLMPIASRSQKIGLVNTSKPISQQVEEVRLAVGSKREVAESVSFTKHIGYDNTRAGYFIALLCDFFEVPKLEIHNGFVAGPVSLSKPIPADKQTGIQFLLGNFYAFIIEDGLPSKPDKFQFLQGMPQEIPVNLTVSVQHPPYPQIPGDKDSTHAITLLTCGGKQFLYDDNVSILAEIPWRTVFLGDPNDMAYYYIFTRKLMEEGFHEENLLILGCYNKNTKLNTYITKKKSGITRIEEEQKNEAGEALTSKQIYESLLTKYSVLKHIVYFIYKASFAAVEYPGEGGKRKMQKTRRYQRIRGKKSRKQSRR